MERIQLPSFTHLHVHSHYSLLESSLTVEDLVKTAKLHHMEAVALTDKYMMSGAVEFYNAALSAGIKPIIGCEICLSDDDGIFHLVLLAKDRTGYGNLCRLVSSSHLEGGGRFPSVDMDCLRQAGTGLIGLSGCMNGKIPRLLQKGLSKKALETAGEYSRIFKGDFYIELQRFPHPADGDSLSEVLAGFAAAAGIPVAAANNVHYAVREHYGIYRQLFRLKTMSLKKDPLARLLPGSENYLKTAQEMCSLFRDIPEAVSNTSVIRDSCCLELETGRTCLPVFRVDDSDSEAGCLRRSCLEGLEWRLGDHPAPAYASRLEKELSIIEKTGFSGYFLIIADMVRFARKNKIPTCGKGSAAGSLVSYILGISDVDPIKLDLYFERFLNPERRQPPDIDIDICSRRRNEVLEYLLSKYGSRNVSRVCSFSTLRPRAAIRETGRIMGLGKDDMDSMVRDSAPGRLLPRRRSHREKGVFLKGYSAGDPLAGRVFSFAGRIENFVRHISMHPSAFIISCTDLSLTAPLMLSHTGEIMTQYDMDSIEELGLVKTDLIGSVSLSLISDAARSLREKRSIELDMSSIPFDDRKVYDIIMRGDTLGVFQLESSGIRSLAKKLKASSLDDITLLISLYRPGPQQSGMVKDFIERKAGREKTCFLHRDLEPILKDTYGVILYQEQVMRIALKIAGYSLSQADVLRKAITRLSREEMKKQRSRFIKGSLERGYPGSIAENIFDLISKFASYGFVKAHAAAYSIISYRLAYIKAYYPAELICAILSSNSGYYGRARYIEEARRLGLALKLPDINKSGLSFAAEDQGRSIRIPLASIRDLGLSGAGSIIRERDRNGPFRDFIDFYSRIRKNCRINKNAVENIIRSGGFDYTGSSRNSLLGTYHYLRTLRYFPGDISHPSLNPLFKLSPGGGPGREKILQDEARIFGFCVSASPLEYFSQELESYHPSGSASFGDALSGKRQDHAAICCAGIILNRRVEKTKDGSSMLFCTIEDGDGIFEAVFFPASYRKYMKALSRSRAVIIKGSLKYRDGDITLIGKEAIDLLSLKKMNLSYRKESLKRDILMESVPIWKEQGK
jgi:DNA polymerase III subunit alpha